MLRGKARKGKAAGNEDGWQNHEGYKLAKIRRHSGDFDIIFSRSEVEYCN
jgi:hypothetical protein